jgi:hypothetical protein
MIVETFLFTFYPFLLSASNQYLKINLFLKPAKYMSSILFLGMLQSLIEAFWRP